MTLNFRLKPAERCESKSIESDVESRPRPSAVPIQMALEEQWLLAVMGRLGLDGRHVETTAPQKDLGATCRILAAAPPLAIALILDARSRHLGGVLLDPRRRLAVDAFSPAALDDARPGTIADAAEAALAEARVRHSGACHVAALVLRAGDFDVVARVARCGPDRGPAPEPGAHCRELVLWAPEPGAARLEPAPGGPWTFPVLPVRPVAAAAPPLPAPEPMDATDAVVRAPKRRRSDDDAPRKRNKPLQDVQRPAPVRKRCSLDALDYQSPTKRAMVRGPC